MTEPGGSVPRLYKRLRLAGWLLVLGLLAEVATLYSSRPLAFVAYLAVGGTLVALGILVYLWSIASGAG
jgi:hypothetical protein